jgi:hypothetical protein
MNIARRISPPARALIPSAKSIGEIDPLMPIFLTPIESFR